VDYYAGSNIDEQKCNLKIAVMISQPVEQVLDLCTVPTFNGFPSMR